MAKSADDKPKLDVRVKPPQAVRVRRPVVMIIVGLIFFVIVFAIVETFNVSANSSSNKMRMTEKQSTTPTVSEDLKTLPQSYSQSDVIKKYLDTSPKPSTDIPAAVQQELSNLRQQQTSLQQKLSELTAQQQEKPQDTLQLQQAKTSGLFFPGVAPPRETLASQTEKTTDTAQSTSSQTERQHMSDYEKQNMQMQKIDFLKPSKETEQIYDKHSLVKPLSPYEIQAGTLIPASLITGIDTTLPGDVVAQVQDDIFDTVSGKYLLVPKGSKFLGKYDTNISYGQERVLIVFYRIIRPDGSSILLSKSTGADLFGQAGMKGDVNNHWARIIGAATLSALLGLGAGAASDNLSNDNTFYRSSAQSAALGAAGSIVQTGQQLTSKAMNIQPTLTIKAGYQFDVIVNKDMILEPYR